MMVVGERVFYLHEMVVGRCECGKVERLLGEEVTRIQEDVGQQYFSGGVH